MIFVLEDSPDRLKWFKRHWSNLVHADTPFAGLELLQKHDDLEMIFLDHDLGGPFQRGPHGDGIDLVDLMVKEKLHVDTPIVVHSLNPGGAQTMVSTLRKTHSDVRRIPFYLVRNMVDAGVDDTKVRELKRNAVDTICGMGFPLYHMTEEADGYRVYIIRGKDDVEGRHYAQDCPSSLIDMSLTVLAEIIESSQHEFDVPIHQKRFFGLQ